MKLASDGDSELEYMQLVPSQNVLGWLCQLRVALDFTAVSVASVWCGLAANCSFSVDFQQQLDIILFF